LLSGYALLRKLKAVQEHEFEFDVFISYNHKDMDWVKKNLDPKLTSLEISYSLDYKAFTDALSMNAEMLRLIAASCSGGSDAPWISSFGHRASPSTTQS
jgi:hypothetical protein